MGAGDWRMNWRRELFLTNLIAGTQFAVGLMTRPLVPLYAQALDAAPAMIGVIVGAFAFLPLLLAVPAGGLADRVPFRYLMRAGALGLVVGGLLAGLFPGVWSLFLAQVVWGLGQLLLVVAGQARVASLGGDRDRESNLSLYGFYVSAGQLAGPLLGGGMAEATGYTGAFLLSAAMAVIPLALSFLLEEPRTGNGSRRPPRAELGEVRDLLARNSVKLGIVSSFAVLFSLGIMSSFFPIYVEDLGFGPLVVTILVSARAAFSMLVKSVMPRLTPLVGRFTLLVFSLGLIVAGTALIPVSSTLLSLFIVVMAIGSGTGWSQPLSMLAVADAVPASRRGLAMGVRLTGNRLAQFLNPLLFGFVVELAGMKAAFFTASFLLLVTTAGLWLWRRDQAEAEAGLGRLIPLAARRLGRHHCHYQAGQR